MTGTAKNTLTAKIRAAMRRVEEAERLELGGDPRAQAGEHWNKLHALEDRIPDPPRSMDDIIIRAELAFFCASKTTSGALLGLHSSDTFERSVTRLVHAVMRHAGVSVGGGMRDDGAAERPEPKLHVLRNGARASG